MRLLAIFRHPPELARFCIAELKALFRIHNIQPHELFDFTSPEHEQLAKDKPYLINEDLFPNFPFVYLKDHPEEILHKIVERAILVKGFVRVISEGSTYEELIGNVNLEEMKPYLETKETFIFRVEPHSKTYTREEQINIINKFAVLPFQGTVNLSKPKYRYSILEDWYRDPYAKYTLKKLFFALDVCAGLTGINSVNYKYELARRAYLGPTSADNDLAFLMANQAGVVENTFVLDPFLGTGGLLIPPSHFKGICFGGEIDARVLHGVGVGRYNKKSEYDLKENKPDIWLNFKQYGFNLPEIIRMDTSRHQLALKEFFDCIICDPPYGWRATVRTQGKSDSRKEKDKKKEAEKLQAEEKLNSGEKIEEPQPEEKEEIESAKEEAEPVKQEEPKEPSSQNPLEENKEENKANEKVQKEEFSHFYKNERKVQGYIVATKVGHTDDVVEGLFNLANNVLKKNGKLVFLFPTDFDETPSVEKLPKHPNFELVDYCEERIKMAKSRILVTMQKKENI